MLLSRISRVASHLGAGWPDSAEFSPFGRLLSLGSFMKNTNVSQNFGPLVSTVVVIYYFLMKYGFGLHFGRLFSQTHLVTPISSKTNIVFTFGACKSTYILPSRGKRQNPFFGIFVYHVLSKIMERKKYLILYSKPWWRRRGLVYLGKNST
jgi:hypothetical protein